MKILFSRFISLIPLIKFLFLPFWHLVRVLPSHQSMGEVGALVLGP